MNEENNPYRLNGENNPEIYQMNSHFVHNGNWGKENMPHLAIWTGWPENANQLTNTNNLNLLLNVKNVAFGHFFLGGLTAFDKNKIKKCNIEVINSSKSKINAISYSAGIYTFRYLPEEFTENFSVLKVVNPMMGCEVVSEKLGFVKIPHLPFPPGEVLVNDLGQFMKKMWRDNKLEFIVSAKDEYLNPNHTEKILNNHYPGVQVKHRDGGHGITPKEVVELFVI